MIAPVKLWKLLFSNRKKPNSANSTINPFHDLDTMQKYLLVGLGNIGTEYQDTRHNIGFAVADALAQKKEASFQVERYASVATFKHRGRGITLIKPTTYMNLSGKAVRHWQQQTNVPTANILIIVDDLDLDLGILRLKAKGSDGGHNGLKNITELLQTNKYPRLRFGIGKNYSRGKQVDYVLGKFTTQEAAELPNHIDKAVEACLSFVSIGLAQTMTQFNKK